ncbi:MAG TPA: tRNA (guanosine(37)-N1)-methyltransferase TrmD [Elusimicrobiota bacterium]|nr:tRNA (guanosine(37)-N1)-methyltransferase TrmD [Elusimicrobiota bacterium]
MKNSVLRRLDVITLFPKMFDGPLSESLLGRAQAAGIVRFEIYRLRDFSTDARRHKVDDRPYGGGAGMVLEAEPIYRALQAARQRGNRAGMRSKPHVIYLSPQGRLLNQAVACELAGRSWIILLCGHYEGVDERVMRWVDEEVSIGDYVLTGGELPAMVLADTVVRLVPGVVKEAASILNDSFQEGRLDYPHYTRPAVWRGQKVPAVLVSGDHAKIKAWRESAAWRATEVKRPDLAVRRQTRTLRRRSPRVDGSVERS